MKSEDLKERLRDAKFRHLTEDELDSYHDQTLDTIGQGRADAHLQVCLICEQRLAILKEESAILENREVTADDVALVRRVMRQMGLQEESYDARKEEAKKVVPARDRFAESLRQIVVSWQAHFMPREAVRGTRGSGKAIWEDQGEDSYVKAYATLERDASLTIHFYSDDLSLEGRRFKVSLGAMNREITLELEAASRVYAKVEITRYQLPINLAAIDIQPVT
jgi:hypothetical protein